MGDVMVRIMCPNLACRRILAVPSSARGKVVKCSGCSKLVRVPSAPVAPVAPGASDIPPAAAPAANAQAPAAKNSASTKGKDEAAA